MSRKLIVEIVGDDRDLLRKFDRDSRAARGFNRDLGRMSRGALVGTGALGGLGRAAAFASGAFIGGAGLTFALKSTISAAMEAQRVQGQLANALEHQGISFEKNAKAIDARTQALSEMSGFDDELLSTTFTGFVRLTGSVTKALERNALAVQVARGRNIELSAAAQLVTKAQLGLAGSLRRVGIAAETGASATELLDLLQRKFAGSAEAYGRTAAGAQERFRVALENTQEIIGTALLPSITKLLNRATEWLNKTENQERIQRAVNDTADKGSKLAGFLADSYNKVAGAYQKIQDADPFGGRSIKDIAAFGQASSFTLDVQIAKWHALEAAVMAYGAAVGAAMNQVENLRVTQPTGAGGGFNLPRPSGSTFVGRPLTDAEQLRIALAGNPDDVAALTQQRAAKQKVLDFALKQIRLERGNTAKFAVAAERLSGDIAGINSRLVGVAEGEARSAEDAADKIKAARQKNMEALRAMFKEPTAQVTLSPTSIRAAVRSSLRVLEARKAAARQASQFRALGLSGAGDELAPGRQALRSQASKLGDALKGTFLDTGKTRSVMAGIRRALKLGVDGMSQDVRRTVKDMLDDLDRQLGDQAKTGNETKFRTTNVRRILAGAGLSPEDVKAASAALSRRGPGGTVPSRGRGAFGVALAGRQGDIVVHSVLQVDGQPMARNTTRHQQKAKARNPVQKRGPHAP